jgi:hypothetical protein
MNRPWLRVLCAGALALTALLAHAQYSWIDEKGSRVFSDRPPPAGTPPARILKAPNGLASTPLPVAAQGAAAEPGIPAWKQREAEFRNRMAQQEKAAEEQRRQPHDPLAEERRRNARKARCAWAKSENEQFYTPRRPYLTNSKGENVVPRAWNRAIVRDEVKQALADCS